MTCSFARAASSIPCACGNRQEAENSQLVLTSLDELTAYAEAWKIQEKDFLLNRVGNVLNTSLISQYCTCVYLFQLVIIIVYTPKSALIDVSITNVSNPFT